MSNAPAYFVPNDVKRISRSKLHKYLIRERSEEIIFNEIRNGPACIYQQTKNGHSSLFLALARNKENIIKKLLDIYENDHRVLIENGFKEDTAVLIAFGAKDIVFAEEKLSKISSEVKDNDKNKFLILIKETNESASRVKSFSPKTEDEQKLLLEIIEKLHSNGTFDINTPNNNGDTLFLVAASQGLIWVLEKLLDFGARHNMLNKQLSSPFEFACINNQMETVKWYSKKFKPDLLKFMMEGNSLFSIARHGSFEAFDYILSVIRRQDGDEHIKEIFSRRTEYHDCNLLMEAVNTAQPEFALKCLKFEPDLNVVDSSGSNLLHIALKAWPLNEELCRTLTLKQPELLVMEDSNQWTPLHHLATRNLLKVLKDIYEKFPGYKNVFFKHFVDSPTVEKTLLQIWCPTPGHSALNNIVSAGHFEMAEFILTNYAGEFDSAAYISDLVIQALPTGSIEFIETLQKMKAFDINVPDENYNYPLLVALRDRKLKIFQHLLKSCVIKNINAMVEPHTKRNLLYFAIYKKPEVFKGTFLARCFPPDDDSSEDEKKETPQPLQTRPEPEAKTKMMFDIFKELIKRGADVNHKAQYGTSLLHVAVDFDDLEVVEELLKHGLKTDVLDEFGNSPLHHVKSVEVFKALIANEETSKVINLKNVEGRAQGRTPFMNMVSYFGNEDVPIELVEEFLKHNCDINAVDNEGCRPIHLAVTEEWIKVLIDNGADINAINSKGENVIHIALKNAKWPLAKFLFHNTEIDRFTVTNDEISYLGYFLTANVTFNEIFDGDLVEVYDKLLDKFINGKNLIGGLILNNFIKNSDLEKIQHPKADLQQVEADGKTCLHNAVTFNSNIEVLKVLVDAGSDINAVDKNGFTPLMFSTDYDFTDTALFLIEQENINLNLSNSYGFTALHYAARNENIEIVCKLLAAGADPHISTNENKTFYDYLKDFDRKLFAFYGNIH